MSWLIRRAAKQAEREAEGENPALHRLLQLFFLVAGVGLIPLGIWGDDLNGIILGVVCLVGLLFYRIDCWFSRRKQD